MRFVYYLAELFVDTFGITRPSPEMRTRAAAFIFGLLLLTVLLVVTCGIALHFLLR